MVIAHDVGEYLEIRRAARDIEVRGETDRLAGVGNLGSQKIVETGGDAVHDARHDLEPVGERHGAPGSGKRRFGGLDRVVDVFPARFVNRRNDAAVHRADILENLAAARAVFPIDKVKRAYFVDFVCRFHRLLLRK